MSSFRRARLARLFAVVSLASYLLISSNASAAPQEDNAPETATSTQNQTRIVSQTPIIDSNTPELDLDIEITHQPSNSASHLAQPNSGTVTVKVGRRTPVNQHSLEQWMSANLSSERANLVTVASKETTLTSPKTRVKLKIPSDELPFDDPEQWGPRFLEVTFHPRKEASNNPGKTDATEKTDASNSASSAKFSARSLLLWDSGAGFEPSPMLVFAPLAISGDDMAATFSKTRTGKEWLLQRRLEEVCLLAAKYPLTLAYDPLLLAPELSGETQATDYLKALGAPVETAKIPDPPSPEKQGADTPDPAPSAYEPLEKLSTLQQQGKCGSQSFFYLPPGDFSVSPLAHLDTKQREIFLDAAKNLSAKVTKRFPDFQDKLIVWPTSESTDRTLTPLQFASEIETWGERPLLVEDTTDFSTKPSPKSYDIDSRRAIVINNDVSTTGWVVNERLSSWFNFQNNDGLSELQTRQLLLASTAVFTRQRPFSPRLLVLTTPRNYRPDKSQQANFSALTSARWLTFPDASELTPDQQATSWLSSVEDEVPPSLTPEKTELQRSYLKLHSQATALANASSNPTKLADIFAALTVTNSRASMSNQTNELALEKRLVGMVKAQPVSVINLIDKQAKIPVSVTNGLDSSVTLRVNLKASDTRLQFGEVTALTIPAGSTAQAHIPVKAVGHGDVTVRVGLTNSAGEPVGTSEKIQVRVRAEWESTGIYILAGFLAVVLVGGIIRRVVKGRKTPALEA